MTSNIVDIEELIKIRKQLRKQNKKVVFTNGCFDILHAGHVDYLMKAKACGDVLIVALNSDQSVARIKGNKRPITSDKERALVVSQLKCVDYVIFFSEDTPRNIIQELLPDILVKGADWKVEDIVGRDIVESNGGEVRNINFEIDQSTSKIIKRIVELYKD